MEGKVEHYRWLYVVVLVKLQVVVAAGEHNAESRLGCLNERWANSVLSDDEHGGM
jgi:hypothetical protein